MEYTIRWKDMSKHPELETFFQEKIEKLRKFPEFYKIPSWHKKDTTGICLIAKRKFKDFIDDHIENKPGDIIDISPKAVVGKHEGLHYFTLGQSPGVGLAGNPDKYLVCKKDLDKNIS